MHISVYELKNSPHSFSHSNCHVANADTKKYLFSFRIVHMTYLLNQRRETNNVYKWYTNGRRVAIIEHFIQYTWYSCKSPSKFRSMPPCLPFRAWAWHQGQGGRKLANAFCRPRYSPTYIPTLLVHDVIRIAHVSIDLRKVGSNVLRIHTAVSNRTRQTLPMSPSKYNTQWIFLFFAPWEEKIYYGLQLFSASSVLVSINMHHPSSST